MEATDWFEAVFDTVGSENPGSRIVQSWLYLDTNANKMFDPDDFQLGEPVVYDMDQTELVFSGFMETLLNNQPIDFFVVCELASETVANGLGVGPIAGPAPIGGSSPALLGAKALRNMLALTLCAIVAAAVLALARRGDWAPRLAYLTCAFAVSILPLTGCGGGGGGGGSATGSSGSGTGGGAGDETLRLDLVAIEVTGTTSGQPAAIEGLPLTGWDF
jgi:hypothetical protein